MLDTPATRNVYRARLLSMAVTEQQRLKLDDPIDRSSYREGLRDAYANAAAMVVTGGAGNAATAAADRVVDLLKAGIQDLGVLMDATVPAPRPVGELTWMGQISFDRLVPPHPFIDHDLGTRWGARHDIRITHRRPHDGTTGVLYAYDRTWDEYAILNPAAPLHVIDRAYRTAIDRDPHLPLADFITILHQPAATVAAQPDSPGVQL